ncbi:uncharacterized protein [Choristoneura fumiferana]|uniref:uncharacterized protein n=1 Tax=Choristoneura fumiferana TaxID=7141 RepID=UPI003D1585D1
MPLNNLCEVDGCQSKSGKDVSFFKLPRDEERRKEWCDLIGRPDLAGPNIKFGSHIICNRHFAKSEMTIIPRLNPNALPSRELPNHPSTFKGIRYNKELDKIDNTTQTDGNNMVDKCIQTTQKVNDEETQTTIDTSKRKLTEELREEKKKTMKLQNEVEKLKELLKREKVFYEERTKRLKTGE